MRSDSSAEGNGGKPSPPAVQGVKRVRDALGLSSDTRSGTPPTGRGGTPLRTEASTGRDRDRSRSRTPEIRSEGGHTQTVNSPPVHKHARTAGHGPDKPSATLRLHQAAICGLLWCPDCQALAAGGPGGSLAAVPLAFASPPHYVSVFEPLLHEEARCGLINSWEEAQTGGGPRGWQVNVSDVQQQPRGWFLSTITAAPQPGPGGHHRSHHGGKRGAGFPERLRTDTVVVLSKMVTLPPPSRPSTGSVGGSTPTAANAIPGLAPGPQLVRVAALVRQGGANPADPVKLSLHPACPAHDPSDRGAPCMQALNVLFSHPTGWTVTPVGGLVTSEREVETLGRVAQGEEGPMRSLLPVLLDPVRAAQQCKGQYAQLWPGDFTSPELMSMYGGWLADTYDLPQREAIQIATSHLALPDQQAASPIPVLPFTLIQGPPGTGKTHTVKGILNTWHVIRYRRYHDSWRREAARLLLDLQVGCKAWDRDQRALELLSELHTSLPGGMMRPRVLVCAPSNAATDELCERILKEGFRDLQLNVTFPDVARIGSEDAAMSPAVQDVWIEARVRWYMGMTQPLFALEFRKAEARLQQATQAMTSLLGKLDHYATRGHDGMMELAGVLVDLQHQRTRAEVDMARLGMVAPLHAPGHRVSEWKMREDLELSLMEGAELVFTTLSSTGRNVFSRVKRAFDAVLVDEACQAAEVAALQPLVHGTSKVVLVGDPKQLPATLFSRAARDTALERSLFERLAQAGIPVKLLSVQYRMHPEIRRFPSAYFYDNQLQDAPQVSNAPPASFYHARILKPYVVFDVARGREGSGVGGRSKCNEAEARFVAALFWELRCVLMAEMKAAQQDPTGPAFQPVEVGVVTPYRSQRDLLRRVFAELLGPDVLRECKIETVDSFQGKQLDVIILSCVRAFATPPPAALTGGGGSGSTSVVSTSIGFLSDVRRLNVAITRAKKALWVVGHADSLAHNKVWSALLRDAEQRSCLVHDAHADDPELMPRFMQLLHTRTSGGHAHAHAHAHVAGPDPYPASSPHHHAAKHAAARGPHAPSHQLPPPPHSHAHAGPPRAGNEGGVRDPRIRVLEDPRVAARQRAGAPTSAAGPSSGWGSGRQCATGATGADGGGPASPEAPAMDSDEEGEIAQDPGDTAAGAGSGGGSGAGSGGRSGGWSGGGEAAGDGRPDEAHRGVSYKGLYDDDDDLPAGARRAMPPRPAHAAATGAASARPGAPSAPSLIPPATGQRGGGAAGNAGFTGAPRGPPAAGGGVPHFPAYAAGGSRAAGARGVPLPAHIAAAATAGTTNSSSSGGGGGAAGQSAAVPHPVQQSLGLGRLRQ